MSDLIERLQDVWDGKATFPTERLPEIIEQLKTVRGIEGLAKKNDGIEILPANNESWIVCIEYTEQFKGTTLAAAVEAAGKKGERR